MSSRSRWGSVEEREVVGISWNDIDEDGDEAVLTIWRQIVSDRDGLHVDGHKTKVSWRTFHHAWNSSRVRAGQLQGPGERWDGPPRQRKEYEVDPETGDYVEIDPEVVEAERAERNLSRAKRRALQRIRQYCAKNRLTKMWTLTYAEVTPKKQVKRDVNDLMDRWRVLKGGEKFPYAYVLELHKDGERWHVHVAAPKEYMDKHRLQAAWGHGIVRFDESPWVSRRGISERERARRLSKYLSKYMAKSMGEDREKGEHRYEVAQGFRVRRVSKSFATCESALAWIKAQEAGNWEFAWESDAIEGWDGPPAWDFRSG